MKIRSRLFACKNLLKVERGHFIMSKTKTTVEKIDDIKTKIEQLQNEQKRLLQIQKKKERDARTKRLIERGAILESLMNSTGISAADFTNEQIKSFLEKTVTSDYARKILAGFTAQKDKTSTEKTAWKVNGNGAAVTEKNEVSEEGAV